MKHLFKTTIILALALSIISCAKEGDPIIPDPGPGIGDSPELWNYDIGAGSVYDITPAIDENDNIYFSIAKTENTKVVAVGLDKDGNELREPEIERGNRKILVNSEDGEITREYSIPVRKSTSAQNKFLIKYQTSPNDLALKKIHAKLTRLKVIKICQALSSFVFSSFSVLCIFFWYGL